MDQESLRLFIRRKIQNGRLPHDGITRVWSSRSDGETCDACDATLAEDQLLMEAVTLDLGRRPIQLHVRCFQIWDHERRAISHVTEPTISSGFSFKDRATLIAQNDLSSVAREALEFQGGELTSHFEATLKKQVAEELLAKCTELGLWVGAMALRAELMRWNNRLSVPAP